MVVLLLQDEWKQESSIACIRVRKTMRAIAVLNPTENVGRTIGQTSYGSAPEGHIKNRFAAAVGDGPED